MKTKLLKSIKAITLFSFALFSIIACEKDFENVGVGLVDNDQFKADVESFNVAANTKNVEFSRVDGLPIRNLGILRYGSTNNFGVLKASLISQLGLPTTFTNFPKDAVIDTVILDIPYIATKVANTDNKNEYRLDSVFGDQNIKYKLKVSRLQTFLNTLDPSDPTKRKKYYSNEDIAVTNDVLFYGDFNPNKNDTVLFVKRPFFDGKESIDTILKGKKEPSIKLPLNESLVKQLFIDTDPSNYTSIENFVNYFRGIRIDAEEIGSNGGTMMTLATSGAAINIYYTYEALTDETTTDLNGDGDTDDKQVPVKTKETATLSFSGITSNIYDRDYSGSNVLNSFNSNSINGQNELFVQGSAGSNVEIDIFKNINLEEYRNKDWLINGAVLDLYIKDSTDIGVPNRLYLYKKNNVVIKDVVSESRTFGIGGVLSRDANNKPEKYTFYLTDYISDVLAKGSTIEPSNLILKTYHSTDAVNIPRTGVVTDTIVDNFSWNVKGVVLKGNSISNNDTEKLVLKIYYTENSNE